jgi:hypothetical protein
MYWEGVRVTTTCSEEGGMMGTFSLFVLDAKVNTMVGCFREIFAKVKYTGYRFGYGEVGSVGRATARSGGKHFPEPVNQRAGEPGAGWCLRQVAFAGTHQ